VTRDTISAYNRGFREFGEAFEAFGFRDIHKSAIPFLPKTPGVVLDIGAGSGRDADWFAAQGWEVIAAEPAKAMREAAARRHASPLIRWIDDRLPGLEAVHRFAISFGLIWLSGVWMHVHPEERPRAMRKLATLLKPGGRIMLTLRHGPAPDDRPMWPVDASEIERLGLEFGLSLRVATERADDLQGRSDISWQTIILELPDDGAGALPLLRGVILRQEKSATYKLALLRAIARIADASPNIARDQDSHVELPLGLIALNWIRMFKPLVEAGLPQRPGAAMGFVTDAFNALRPIAPFDLRVGATFRDDLAAALRLALSHAARLIADMPARHLTFANDAPVFPTAYGKIPPSRITLCIDHELLWAYGTTRVPANIWQALRRMSAWIEPMLLAEWVRLTSNYAEKLNKIISPGEIMQALQWIEPTRDTGFVRDLARNRLRQGQPITCVWTNRPLAERDLDIDHCLPWSAWQCGDLWNLLPTAPAINRHSKSGRIVAPHTLNKAKPQILEWWQSTYLNGDDTIRARFSEEAHSTLPITGKGAPDLEELFQALDFRRLRLRQDTQIAEWNA
jgi:SAM-dependent methyltransferase